MRQHPRPSLDPRSLQLLRNKTDINYKEIYVKSSDEKAKKKLWLNNQFYTTNRKLLIRLLQHE